MLSTFPRSVTFSTFFVSELNSAPGSSKSKQDCSDKVPAKAANEREDGMLNNSNAPKPLAVDNETSGSTGLSLYKKNRFLAMNDTFKFLF